MKKPLIAIGMTGAILFSVAGCAGSIDKTEPEPTSPTAVSCSTENPGPWGDVVASELVKDELGEYCHVTIDPNSDALKYDASKVDTAALEEHGFTQEDAEAAQKTSVKFVVEEVSDSPYLDSTADDAVKEWYAGLDGYTFTGEGYSPADNDSIFTGLTPTVRDSASRSKETNVQLVGISAQGSTKGDGGVLVTHVQSQSFYRMDDDSAVNFMLESGRYEGTKEQLIAEQPMFADGKENALPVSINYRLAFNKAGEITGNAFEYAVQNFI